MDLVVVAASGISLYLWRSRARDRVDSRAESQGDWVLHKDRSELSVDATRTDAVCTFFERGGRGWRRATNGRKGEDQT